MFLSDVANSGSIPALDAMLSFTQANHRVLAENIANIDTPGYQAKHLDARKFQKALAGAIAQRQETRSGGLVVEDTNEFEQQRDGSIRFRPGKEPAENVLFHDQTNARIEKQMSLLAENAMMHQTASELLAGKYQEILKAIRGRTG